MEEFSFLQNFSSLLEVFTAIYVSMFIDEVLSNFWTPDYQDKISKLIEEMKIPAIKYFVVKVKTNIGKNAEEIGGHMKRKAAFFFAYCLSFLLLAGLEAHSPVMKSHGYVLVIMLSLIGGVFIITGRWMFYRLRMVAFSICIYALVFLFLYFSSFVEFISSKAWFPQIDDKTATISFLVVMTVPILWQIVLIWLYSRCYSGFMQARVSKEAYIYGKAYLAYKLKDMAALPTEYEVVARDFVSEQVAIGDTSLRPLNEILVRRLEPICNAPEPLSLIWSYIKYNFRGRHNPEVEYIERYGFDYEVEVAEEHPAEGILVEDEQPVDAKKVGWGFVPYCVMGIVGCIAGLFAFWRKRY